jgi:hypothetical protein
MIGGKPSRLRARILKQNGIRSRHYAIDREGRVNYWNCELAAGAAQDAISRSELALSEIELLAVEHPVARARRRDRAARADSLQLDETVGLYVARILNQSHHLGLLNNKHPMVPLSTLAAGFRLMLRGLAAETLHATLREQKRRAKQTLSK